MDMGKCGTYHPSSTGTHSTKSYVRTEKNTE